MHDTAAVGTVLWHLSTSMHSVGTVLWDLLKSQDTSNQQEREVETTLATDTTATTFFCHELLQKPHQSTVSDLGDAQAADSQWTSMQRDTSCLIEQ